MLKRGYIQLIIIVLLIFSGCKRNECNVGKNEQVKEEYALNGFDFIKMEGIFNIELVQDTQNFVVITCPKAYVDNISATVSDSILTLENYNSCYFLHNYDKALLTLHVNDLKRIQLGQPCAIYSGNALTSNIFIEAIGEYAELNLELSGNIYIYNNYNSRGIFKLKGDIDNAVLNAHGGAVLDARYLNVRHAVCNNYSIADLYVGKVEILEYTLNSSANIFYKEADRIINKSEAEAEGKLLPW